MIGRTKNGIRTSTSGRTSSQPVRLRFSLGLHGHGRLVFGAESRQIDGEEAGGEAAGLRSRRQATLKSFQRLFM